MKKYMRLLFLVPLIILAIPAVAQVFMQARSVAAPLPVTASYIQPADPSNPIPPTGGYVTVDMGPEAAGKLFTIEWWDTYESDPAKQILQVDQGRAMSDGSIVLYVEVSSDVAPKIFPAAVQPIPNTPPTAEAFAPDGVDIELSEWATLTATYADMDGAVDIEWAFLFLNTPALPDGLDAFYERQTGEIGLIGQKGCLPGDNRGIDGGSVILDCRTAEVTLEGNILTVDWPVLVMFGPEVFTAQLYVTDGHSTSDSQILGGMTTHPPPYVHR